MNLADFDYEYPKGQVAQRPLARRDASRMMVFDRCSGGIRHSFVTSLPEFLKAGDLVVVNDSKVAPARIFGRRGTGEALEVLVIEPAEPGRRGPAGQETWRCLLKKAKRIRDGEKFFFGMQATATARGRDGIFLLLEFAPGALSLAMKHHGAPPLPPYIEREGLAAYTSAVLVPNTKLTEILGFDGATIDALASLLPRLAADVLARLDSPDPALKRAYLGMEPNDSWVPPGAGYYVGLMLVMRLAETHDLASMMRWDAERVRRTMLEVLPSLAVR